MEERAACAECALTACSSAPCSSTPPSQHPPVSAASRVLGLELTVAVCERSPLPVRIHRPLLCFVWEDSPGSTASSSLLYGSCRLPPAPVLCLVAPTHLNCVPCSGVAADVRCVCCMRSTLPCYL